jgi:hypothetical protein
MALKIVEIHRPAPGINGSEPGLAANRAFYEGVLGLAADPKRPTLSGLPGLWINVGEVGQSTSSAARSPHHWPRRLRTRIPRGRMSHWPSRMTWKLVPSSTGWVSTTG